MPDQVIKELDGNRVEIHCPFCVRTTVQVVSRDWGEGHDGLTKVNWYDCTECDESWRPRCSGNQ